MAALKSVLVKFPADVLASLDAEAARRGVARMALIIEKCGGAAPTVAEAKPAPVKPAPKPKPAPMVDRIKAPPIPKETRPDARAALAEAEAKAAHLARPKGRHEITDYVPAQWGDNRAPIGSRLKGAGRRERMTGGRS